MNIPGMKTVAITLMAAASVLIGAHPSHAERPESGRSQSQTQTDPGATSGSIGAPPQVIAEVAVHEVVQYVNAVTVGEYVHSVQMAQVTDYVNAVARSEVEARAAAAPRSYSAPSGGGNYSGTGECGGATNGADQYIHRESGGDPYIGNGGGHYASPYDAGRAFGCYQILPSTWSGSCSDITTYDPASQARCASRLPDSAWAL